MALWYIDALDARAGMGFATYRDADLDDGALDLGKPAVFISPPFFQGESVASRAIGFAATRGSFQYGLFVDGEEVGFASIQGVCEFIRRAYVSSAGGDTDSGASPAPIVPNPEPEGGELPAMAIHSPESPFVRDFLKFAMFINTTVGTISRSNELSTRKDPRFGPLTERLGSLTGIEDLLGYGAAILIDEMMRRAPNDTRMRGTWIRSTMKLGQLLSEMGLLHWLFRSSAFHALSKLAEAVEARFRLFDAHPRSPGEVLGMILGFSRFYSEYLKYGPPPFLSTIHGIRTASDPMDDLSSFAIPAVGAKYVGLNPTTASARDLLSVILADPSLLLGRQTGRSQSEPDMIVAITLLSSIRITSIGRASVAPIDGTTVAGALLQDLVKEAMVWMDSQMPAFLFHADVEKCIRGASQLRYAPPPATSRTAQPRPRVQIRSSSAGA